MIDSFMDRRGREVAWKVPGSAPALFVAGETPLLHVESQVFEAMLVDWRDQQRSRNLSSDMMTDRLRAVRRFQSFTNDWPWTWRPVDVEEFTSELRSGGRALSTARAYQGALRQFCDYVADPQVQLATNSMRCRRIFRPSGVSSG